MASPGNLSSSQLTAVSNGAKLSTKTARAFNAMQKAHPQIQIAGKYGGYRSAAVQNGMHHAGGPNGTAAERRKYNLNPNSSVSIAAHPYGTHETGDRVDLVGMDLDDIIRIAKEYGFTREFGAADPNHFKHDGVTAVSVPKAVKRPGRIDYTASTGKPNVTFYRNLQWYARQHGTYTGPLDGKLGKESWKGVQAHLKYDGLYEGAIDGKPGVLTYKGLQLLAQKHGGYDGPIDGKLGAQSYKGLSLALNKVP